MIQMDAPKPRLWFRFSLRTLFVVVTVVSLGFGWLYSERERIRERNDVADWINERNRREGDPQYRGVQFSGRKAVPWYRRIIGDQGWTDYIHTGWTATPQERERVRRAFPEAKIFIPRQESPH